MKKKTIILTFISVITMGCGLIFYTLLEPYWLEIKEDDFYSPDVPPAFQLTKVVFISDIHHADYFSLKRVRQVVETVNKLKPDLIILGGDYVYYEACYTQPCFSELKKLTAPLGIYGVLGNHDYWADPENSKQSLQEAGFFLLDNNATWVSNGKDRIKIGGVADLWESNQDLQPTLRDVRDTDFVLLVSHNPDYVEQIKTPLIDLVLCGHTHGGQVAFFGLWAPILPSRYGQKYRTGRVVTENTTVIISNGIGTILPPVRFFVRPQINVIYLKRQ
ncbi:metallophosphoesterase [candidate division CSSED10-310 bacterium]|uniref:Metallophosphoesterase n=1 Tax=candidate division CSSED10-310 bacterium TaxID=2855610 RepID=A0ABV6YSJ6_UNCC1